MFKSGNTSLVKDLNQQHVLNLVRMHPGISASEIKRVTQLQMSTISYTLRALKEEGFIQEIGYGDSTIQGGKPPVLWDLSPAYGYVIGLELMPKEIRFVVLDFSTKVLFKHTYAVEVGKSVERMESEVVRVANLVLEEMGISHAGVLGMGVSMPGLIDNKHGVIHYSYSFDVSNIAFQEILQRHFTFPVEIVNDANAGALGIKWLSRTEHMVPHILYVTVNQDFRGIGTGLIINHELYEGAHGCAGEVASFLTPMKRRRILARAKHKFGKKSALLKSPVSNERDILPVAGLVEEASRGDAAAIYILGEIARATGTRLAQIIDMFDPHVVIIGGDICEAEKFVAKIIQQRVSRHVMSDCNRDLPIQFSPFGIYSVAMGSTALIFQQIFRPTS